MDGSVAFFPKQDDLIETYWDVKSDSNKLMRSDGSMI